MAHARHKAHARTPRLDRRRTEALVVLSGAAMLVVAAIGASASSPSGVATARTGPDVVGMSAIAAPTTEEVAELRELRSDAVLLASRSDDRLAAESAVAPAVTPPLPETTPAYTTIAVNVRSAASEDAAIVTVLDPGAEIAVTGETVGGYAAIVLEGRLAWVYAEYLASTPTSTVADGVSGAACASGSGVESGLTANAISVHRAVCALFPGVSAYGGLRPGDGGDHGSGRALDIMVSTELGDQIAAYLQAHAGELGVADLIWRQRIWTTERAGDGWRYMEDRGSATANHYDHVHVSVH